MKYWNCGIGPNALFIGWIPNEVEKFQNLICTLWNRSSHWNNSINSNSACNFGMELTPNLNPSLWIRPTAPTPIQWSGDDSNVCFEINWKSWEPGVTSGFFGLLVKPGWREGKSNIWNPLESPYSVKLELKLTPQFLPWSWNWIIPKINYKESELWIGPNSCPMTEYIPLK